MIETTDATLVRLNKSIDGILSELRDATPDPMKRTITDRRHRTNEKSTAPDGHPEAAQEGSNSPTS